VDRVVDPISIYSWLWMHGPKPAVLRAAGVRAGGGVLARKSTPTVFIVSNPPIARGQDLRGRAIDRKAHDGIVFHLCRFAARFVRRARCVA